MGYLCLLLNKQHSILLHPLCNSTTPAAFGMGYVVQLEARTSARRCESNLRAADCAIVTFSGQLFPPKSPRGFYSIGYFCLLLKKKHSRALYPLTVQPSATAQQHSQLATRSRSGILVAVKVQHVSTEIRKDRGPEVYRMFFNSVARFCSKIRSYVITHCCERCRRRDVTVPRNYGTKRQSSEL